MGLLRFTSSECNETYFLKITTTTTIFQYLPAPCRIDYHICDHTSITCSRQAASCVRNAWKWKRHVTTLYQAGGCRSSFNWAVTFSSIKILMRCACKQYTAYNGINHYRIINNWEYTLTIRDSWCVCKAKSMRHYIEHSMLVFIRNVVRNGSYIYLLSTFVGARLSEKVDQKTSQYMERINWMRQLLDPKKMLSFVASKCFRAILGMLASVCVAFFRSKEKTEFADANCNNIQRKIRNNGTVPV